MSNARFTILQARAISDSRISNSQFRTLAALGTFGDKDGWCFPKLRTLAEMLGKSRQAVSKDIQALVALGYIESTPQFHPDGSQRCNLYRLIFDTPQSVVDTHQPFVEDVSTTEIEGGSISEVDALTFHTNDPINLMPPNGGEGAPSNTKPKPSKKGDLMDGILKYAGNGRTDYSEYPEDVREVIQTYCELWSQNPPRRSKKGEFALWIGDARDLLDAGGTKTIMTLRDLKANPFKWMGDAMIGRPGALIKAVRARAGEVSAKPVSQMTTEEFTRYMLDKEISR